MRWIKQGLVVPPPAGLGWMQGYAAVPTALPLADGRLRVFFSGRDERGRSQTGACTLDLGAPGRPPAVSPAPVLTSGATGMFDEHGAMATWAVAHGARHYLYYIGWNTATSVPFRNALGLAVSEDGGASFRKVALGPILDRSVHDPCFVASACVLPDGGRWRMWYLSCVGWEQRGGALTHRYHIKYAESDDGVDWRRDGTVCIDFAGPDEYAISRPSVVRDGDRYRMWYSYRGPSYRIGYAESADGVRWERRDGAVGIDVSPAGWDSEMIAYPHVLDCGGRRYMLYNGNGYGKTGIGLAVLAGPGTSEEQ